MQYSKPMQMLVDEHETITSVLDAVEVMAGQPDDHGPFPREFFAKAVDFFSTFADKCHHDKEERHLFPLIESRGVPRNGGPIGCMLTEHDEGRAHIGAIRAALPLTGNGDLEARQIVREEALAYAALLRSHIFKENNVLFRLGDQFMTPQDKEELWKKFQCTQHGPLPPEAHAKYVALAAELRATAGL